MYYEHEDWIDPMDPWFVNTSIVVYSSDGPSYEAAGSSPQNVYEGLDALQVFINSGRSWSIGFEAPNTLAYSIINADKQRTNDEFNKFPKLKVINFIEIAFAGITKLPHYDSKELEIIRIRQMETNNPFHFVYSEEFAGLRVLEFIPTMPTEAVGICEFVKKLTKLERLELRHVQVVTCIAEDKILNTLAALKHVGLYDISNLFKVSDLCGLFPSTLEVRTLYRTHLLGIPRRIAPNHFGSNPLIILN